jgi:uncharacterized protein (DUF488 family)
VTPLMIFTIGHSTRPIDEFIHLLKAHGVQRVVDVRTIPRHDTIRSSTATNGLLLLRRGKIHYRHMPGRAACGVRGPAPRTPDGAMQASVVMPTTCRPTEFEDSLKDCIYLAKRERVVLMCAEAVPWRCHRSLIADALLARGINASEITSRIRTRPHSLTPFARVRGTHVTYPAARKTQVSARVVRAALKTAQKASAGSRSHSPSR